MSRWIKNLLVIIYFALLTVVYSYPLILNIKTHIPYGYEGPGDGLFAIWNIMSNIKNIEKGNFFSTEGNIFYSLYPEDKILTLNDRSPVNAFLGSIITRFTENRALLFNLLFFLLYILSGYGMFLLSHEITGKTLPSLISATAVSFVGFYTYPQNLYANSWQFFFYSFYFLHRYFKNNRIKDCIFSGLFYIFTCLSTMYVGVMLTYLLAWLFLFYLYNYSSKRNASFIAGFIFTFLLSGGIISLFWFPYLEIYRMIPQAVSLVEKLGYSYSFFSFFSIKRETSLLWWNITGGILSKLGEWEYFLGFTLTFFTLYYMKRRFSGVFFKKETVPYLVFFYDILFGILAVFSVILILLDRLEIFSLFSGDKRINIRAITNFTLLLTFYYFLLSCFVVRERRKIILYKLKEVQPEERFFIYLLIISFILSLGPLGGVYILFDYLLPGISGMRAPHRLFKIGLIACGVLSTISIKDIMARFKKESLGIFILLIAIVEYYNYPMKLYKLPMGDEIPSVYKWLAELKEEIVVVEFPLRKPERFYRSIDEKRRDIVMTTEYMYYSTFHNKKLVNGYSSFVPQRYLDLLEVMVNFPDRASLLILRKLGVNYIIIHKDRVSSDELENIENKLRAIIPPHMLIDFDDAVVIDINEI